MAAQTVLLYPDSRLKTRCAPVTRFEDVAGVVEDLLDTMDAGPPRTVGIAAPQIGVMLHIAIVDVARNPKHPGGNGLITFVNPVIVERDGEQFFREGCLSIPDYTANIRRAQNIAVEYFDANGKKCVLVSEGFESVVIQHEIDHLDGVLFLDRVTDIRADLFRRAKVKE